MFAAERDSQRVRERRREWREKQIAPPDWQARFLPGRIRSDDGSNETLRSGAGRSASGRQCAEELFAPDQYRLRNEC